MRRFLVVALAVMAAGGSAPALAQVSDTALLKKQIEILEHTHFSIGLDDKCKYLSAEDRDTLNWGAGYVASMMVANPRNRLGDNAPVMIKAQMERQAAEQACNAQTLTEVRQTVANLAKLKPFEVGGAQAQTSKAWESLVTAAALNRRCAYYNDAVTTVLATKADSVKAELLAAAPTEAAQGGLRADEQQRRQQIESASDGICSADGEELVRTVIIKATGQAQAKSQSACPAKAQCPMPE